MTAPLLQIHEPGQTPMPHERDANGALAVGIDLGTTNSLVAISRDEKPEVIRDGSGDGIVPSVVAYFGGGAAVVGREAQDLIAERPDCVVSSIKRLMGRAAADIQALAGTLPYDVKPDAGQGGMARLTVAGRILNPVQISAEILRALKQRAEQALGRPVTRAVVTVPAYFDDAARTATRDAARVAGLDVLRLVNEPTAAALAYGLDAGAEGLYAVYDLGGGTFDISLLKMEKGVFQVLGTGGDTALGGDDFDHLIVARILTERGETKPAVADLKRLAMIARGAKEALSYRDAVEFGVEIGRRASRHALDRTQFEAMIAPLVARTVRLVAGVLEDSGVGRDEVKGIVMVGGSTRVPMVRREVTRLFGREPLADIDPDEVVALGAALQAEALTRGTSALLLDVTPLSLGLETMGGIVEKIIPRNSPIPVSRAQEFTTYQDGQSAMSIHVVQGEREMVDQCRSLARFDLLGIPAMTAGAARVKVTFTVDADGLLTVSARETTTGFEGRVEVKPSYGLRPEDMIEMLTESQHHAREDMETRLLAEAKVDARRLLLALGAALAVDGDLLSGSEREALDKAIADVEKTLSGGDRDTVSAVIEVLDGLSKPFAERRMNRSIRRALAGASVEQVERRLGT